MSSAKASTEPSMEDILSSIRQIIADEDAPAAEEEQANDQSAVDDAFNSVDVSGDEEMSTCLLYTSPSPRDKRQSRMPSSA